MTSDWQLPSTAEQSMVEGDERSVFPGIGMFSKAYEPLLYGLEVGS
jgi:hypothetical protein